jgi:hypothetical protein
VVITCRLLGALQVEERGLRGRPNHRLIAVPVKSARREELRTYTDLGKRMQQELERFFVASSAFTSKDPVVRGWVGPDAANEMVQRSISRYRERNPSRSLPQPAVSRSESTPASASPGDAPAFAEGELSPLLPAPVPPAPVPLAPLPAAGPASTVSVAVSASAGAAPAVVLSPPPAFLSEHPQPPVASASAPSTASRPKEN